VENFTTIAVLFGEGLVQLPGARSMVTAAAAKPVASLL
jgi:hypothetical protein